MDKSGAYTGEAVDIGVEAQDEGIATIGISREELRRKAETMIERAKEAG